MNELTDEKWLMIGKALGQKEPLSVADWAALVKVGHVLSALLQGSCKPRLSLVHAGPNGVMRITITTGLKLDEGIGVYDENN